jgi:hypothetical protein
MKINLCFHRIVKELGIETVYVIEDDANQFGTDGRRLFSISLKAMIGDIFNEFSIGSTRGCDYQKTKK